MTATKKQCDTCNNVRGLGKKHFSPHVWCNWNKAYFENEHVCDKWSDIPIEEVEGEDFRDPWAEAEEAEPYGNQDLTCEDLIR